MFSKIFITVLLLLLSLFVSFKRNTYVEDLIEEVVVSPEQVMEWIRKGESKLFSQCQLVYSRKALNCIELWMSLQNLIQKSVF